MTGGKGRLLVGGVAHDVEVERGAGGWRVTVDGESFTLAGTGAVADAARGVVRLGGEGGEEVAVQVEEWTAAGGEADGAGGAHARIRAPMSGRLVEVRVREGEAVGKGDVLFVLEAMKMQNEVRAPAAGVVAAVRAKAGEALDTDRVVMELAPPG